MTREQFREALHRGLGRAVLHARSHDVSAFQDIILDACLHCYAIDPICEGTRGGFMLDVIETLPDRTFYCDAVLAALPEDQDSWHAAQRFFMAYSLAESGYPAARQAMYDAYRPGPSFGGNLGIQFLNLDGMEGFLFAAQKMGALLRASEKTELGWLLSAAENDLGEAPVADALATAGRTDADIEAFRLASQRRVESGRATLAQKSFEEVRGMFQQNARSAITWGAQASPSDLRKAAEALITASNVPDRILYLRVFARAIFPLGPAPLIGFLSNPDRQLSYAALRALSQITHPAVRSLAFQFIEQQSENRVLAIEALLYNHEPDDHALALSWYRAESDPETLHFMEGGLRDLWKSYPQPATESGMLQAIYERTYCSFNREQALRRLLELGAVTEAMRAECLWDADHDIRDLFAT